MNELFLIPYILLNIGAMAAFGYDKFQAAREGWRISEKQLLSAALVGPFGAYAGMRVFRHKIRKPLFSLLVPVFILAHVVLYVMLEYEIL